MRTIFCLLQGLVALFFTLVGGAIALMLPSQAAKDWAYYQQFKLAAAYIDKNGQLPESETGGWRNSVGHGPLIRSSPDIPNDCDPAFGKALTDKHVLSF